MSPIDVELLLQETSPEAPCGQDMSGDLAYRELETMAQGRPEQQIGDVVKPAEEPKWSEVRDRCVEFLKQTKDLRLAVNLAVSLLKIEGVAGIRDGLGLIRGMLERHWDHVHPQLDPEDNNDPTERMNIIMSLSPGPDVYGDTMKFMQRVREAPLCNSRRVGRFSLQDILIATGEMSAPAQTEAPLPEMSVIEAAFEDTAGEELQATAGAVEGALADIQGIDAFLTERVGAGVAPNLSGLESVLRQANKHLQDHLARRGYATATEEDTAAAGEAGKPAEAAAALSGEIRSPKDVLLAFEKICRYYERHEPSSPVPLLVKRAQRLVSRNFMEIIQDLSPDSASQIQTITGVDSGQEPE